VAQATQSWIAGDPATRRYPKAPRSWYNRQPLFTASTRRAKFFYLLVDDRLVMGIIVLNAIVQFLRAFHRWEDVDVLYVLDYACTTYFVIELVVKIGLLGFRDYWKSGWNKFDFVIVLGSSPHLLSPFMDMQDLAVLLVLRTVRLVRVLRLLHFIPERDKLINGMARAIRSSVGVIFALVVYNFVLGLTACYLFRHTGSPYFVDPLASMYAMFKVFTIEGWYDIPDSVAATTTGWTAFMVKAFFVFSVLTGGMLGFSLANAVFVDEMVVDNTDEIERAVEELRAELAEARAESAANAEKLEAALAELSKRLSQGE